MFDASMSDASRLSISVSSVLKSHGIGCTTLPGPRAATFTSLPKDRSSVAVMFDGGLLDTRPTNKLDSPGQMALVKWKVTVPLVCVTDVGATVPRPPLVTTYTWSVLVRLFVSRSRVDTSPRKGMVKDSTQAPVPGHGTRFVTVVTVTLVATGTRSVRSLTLILPPPLVRVSVTTWFVNVTTRFVTDLTMFVKQGSALVAPVMPLRSILYSYAYK